jgi:3-oxoadipate enol-lactonase
LSDDRGHQGKALSFDQHGVGPTVVLIHGHPFDRSMWAPQHRPLENAGFRVVAPDLRGYGESAATPGKVTMSELAGDVLALLDRLEIERAATVGLSMGGLVAMELASWASDRLWALGLVATTAEPLTQTERDRRLALADVAEQEGMRPLVEVMRERLCGPACPEEVVKKVERMMTANNPVGAAAALRGRAERPDYRPRLRNLRLPTFVCAGTGDRFSTAEVTSALIDCLPHATTLILPDVGHLPNLEAPQQFNDALVAFLRTASDPASAPRTAPAARS